jgi:hypothetical protein
MMCVAVVGVSSSVIGMAITLLWSEKHEWLRDWCKKTIWTRLPLVQIDPVKTKDAAGNEQLQERDDIDRNEVRESVNMTGDEAVPSKRIPDGCASFSENAKRIQHVLDYWFGQYPPKLAEKKLWMIPTQNKSWRETVDQDIYERFAETLVELYHSCNGNFRNDDDTISSPVVPVWCQEKEIYGWSGELATIVVFDQFSRHIYRHLQNKCRNFVEAGEVDDNSGNRRLLLTKWAGSVFSRAVLVHFHA